MFDELMKEATAIPFTSKMRFLTELQRSWGLPPEPALDVDTAAGLFKVASLIKTAQGDDEQAALDLERQAMVDPQVQQALDYQQVKNERDEAMAQARGMNQQLFDAQSAQAMADQQAQMTGQQVSELEGALEQETAGRQQAQQEMIASKDQSLQEQMAVQDQKQQMNVAAQTFQEQANMLTQQLKGIAAQPTAPPPAAPPGAPGMGGELPPPATADAAQEQQEAVNAEQEAAIQGDQAAQVTEQDMVQQEQQAAMAGGQVPGGMPLGPMSKAASDVAALAARIRQGMAKTAFYVDGAVPRAERKKQLNQPSWSRENSYKAKDHFEDFLSLAEQKKGKELTKAEVDALINVYNKATGLKVPKVDDWDYGHVPNEAFDAYGGRIRSLIKKAALPKLDPKTQGAIIGAAIGALGGAAGGAVPGMTTGTADTPGSRAGGGMRGFGRGALAGAAAGAAGGALVGHTLVGGRGKGQIGRLAGGAALILGAPILGGVAGAKGAQKDKGFPKFAMSPAARAAGILMGGGVGAGLGAAAGGTAGALSAPEGQRLEALRRGAGQGALVGGLGGALGGGVINSSLGRGAAGAGLLGLSPLAAALVGRREGRALSPPERSPEDEELRQLLPEEQMPKAANFRLAIGNRRGL